MDGYNTEKLTLQDYEAEGLCSGCMFYGAVDVDGRLGCSFHWFDDESEDWNYSKNCDELCGMANSTDHERDDAEQLKWIHQLSEEKKK